MRSVLMILLATSLSLLPCGDGWSQQDNEEVVRLKREVELRDREIDLLKRENELLKRELVVLKQGSPRNDNVPDADDPTRVTVDYVDYVYAGTTRSGSQMIVTVLATSRKGDRQGPNGLIVVVDEEGEEYKGMPTQGFTSRPTLREGVTLKLTWKIGGTNAFTGALLPAPPTTRVTRFSSVSIDPHAGGGDGKIEFRGVPAVVPARKPR